jgi:TrmH family RNA methyltransferase
MVGAEGTGLTPVAEAECDLTVTIPLASGVESLNVAAAAAICLFERRRQVEALRPGSKTSA